MMESSPMACFKTEGWDSRAMEGSGVASVNRYRDRRPVMESSTVAGFDLDGWDSRAMESSAVAGLEVD